ncbi:uncharacterized protein LOC126898031 [Daktulosphaira vitifoliae]|uniref:uncharacterized protein LOC126898031 n=1 Tax=Daktulosphaira vitifoliae TaxID=58002 RepID=UPI0021AAB636|nr:uncharacterized protein LOC126898031 [Daktulosphaira vitifoliae]
MVAKEFQPLSLVENIEIQKLINLLSPSYKLPSRKTLSKSILPQLYAKAKEKVKTNLINWHYIAFTTDGWTSLNNDSFVALTIHYIDKNECTLKSFLLGSHSINTIAQRGLDAIQIVHKKIKRIVEHFKRSSQAYSKLKNMQKQMGYTDLKLIQDITTGWNSTYDIFERCILMKESIIFSVTILGNIENISDEDCVIMQYYCDIFKPFKEITIELSSERDKFNDIKLPEVIHTMLAKMITKAEKKFQGIEDQPYFIENLLSKQQNEIHQTDIEQQDHANDNSQSETEAVVTLSKKTPTSEAIFELDRYLNEPIIERKSDSLL